MINSEFFIELPRANVLVVISAPMHHLYVHCTALGYPYASLTSPLTYFSGG